MHRLFVYGSLQPGGPNEHILASVEGDWQPAFAKGTLVDSGWGAELGYPGLVLDENGSDIDGHVFESSKLGTMWDYLDQLEGEEYERTLASVTLPNGTQVDAYVYVLRR